jgi:hypothetical protein
MGTPVPAEGGAAWLPDPAGRFEQRYWDGRAWTTAVMTDGQVTTDPELPPQSEPGAAWATAMPPPPVPEEPSVVPAPGPGDRYTSLRPDETYRRLGPMLEMQGWAVRAPTRDRLELTHTTPGNPSLLVGLLLLLLWIVPGVIYFIVKSRPKVLCASLLLVSEGDGTRIAVHGDPEAVQRLNAVMIMLPW